MLRHANKVSAGGVALLACVLVGCSPAAAQAPMSGAAAVRAIDWQSVMGNAPIPALMPTSESDDPAEAGFASQWVQRALEPPAQTLALAIVSKHRTAGDRWAQGLEKVLRAIIHDKYQQRPAISRVFCNSVGCLCYVELDKAPLDEAIVYRELLGETGQNFGLQHDDLNLVRTDRRINDRPPVWELTVVKRPNGQ